MIATNLNSQRHFPSWLIPYVNRLQGDYVALLLAEPPGEATYTFNQEEANNLNGKPIVVFDFEEYGVKSWCNESVFGHNLVHYPDYPNHYERERLHCWLLKQNIVCYFKREFSANLPLPLAFPIYPIELLSQHRIHVSPYKSEFMRRHGVFHLYGFSHLDRKLLHGALQVKYTPIANSLSIANQFITKNIQCHLLEEIYHEFRYTMDWVLKMQSNFKLATALSGNGVKTFRHSESCVGSIPVIADVGMKYAVEWTPQNSILLPTKEGCINIEESVKIIDEALQEDLWAIYLTSQEASHELEFSHYLSKYVNQRIKL